MNNEYILIITVLWKREALEEGWINGKATNLGLWNIVSEN